MSKEERDKLRAEGHCFNCKEVGHESRNCPSRRQAKAPSIKAGAINIDEVEAHGKRAREVELNVRATRISLDMEEETEGVPTDSEWGTASITFNLSTATEDSDPDEQAPLIDPSDWENLSDSLNDKAEEAPGGISLSDGSIEEFLRLQFCKHFGCDDTSRRFSVHEFSPTPYLKFEVIDWKNVDDTYLISDEDLESPEFSVDWIIRKNEYDCDIFPYTVPFPVEPYEKGEE